MGRYLKFIGFLVLAFIVWQTSGAAFADGSSAGAEESMDIRTKACCCTSSGGGMFHFAPFAIFAGCGVGKQQRACAVAYHVPYPAFLYYRIYLFIKGLGGQDCPA